MAGVQRHQAANVPCQVSFIPSKMKAVGQTGFSFIPILKPQMQVECWHGQTEVIFCIVVKEKKAHLSQSCGANTLLPYCTPFSALEIHLHLEENSVSIFPSSQNNLCSEYDFREGYRCSKLLHESKEILGILNVDVICLLSLHRAWTKQSQRS